MKFIFVKSINPINIYCKQNFEWRGTSPNGIHYVKLRTSYGAACIFAVFISWALRCNKQERIMILIRAVCSASLKLPAGSISHLKSN